MRPLVILSLVVGCSSNQSASREVTAADLERGHALAGNLKKTLVAELGTATSKGLPSAIEVCQTRAPAIAASLSTSGAVVGRATRRPRNPANRAEGWKLDALAHFEDLHARARPLQSATFSRVLADGRTAYAEPLVIQELCVNCHGRALAEDVRAALSPRYPGDEATGYAVGDLRGIVWVELQH